MQDLLLVRQGVPKGFYPISYWAKEYAEAESTCRRRMQEYVEMGIAEMQYFKCPDRSKRCGNIQYYKIYDYVPAK